VSDRLDWKAWHHDYDDPDSPVSRRLVEVRARLAELLAGGEGPLRVLSLCAGDARDLVPVLSAGSRSVEACLVELDPELAESGRRDARSAGVDLEMRCGDAGLVATFADVLPVDVLLLVGVLGNVSDADAERTIAACASMVVPGGTVLWSRSNRFRVEATHDYDDPAVWVRDRFEAHGFETPEFLVPEVDAWRLGVSRLVLSSRDSLPERLFSFVR
jgi:hypothetical protein